MTTRCCLQMCRWLRWWWDDNQFKHFVQNLNIMHHPDNHLLSFHRAIRPCCGRWPLGMPPFLWNWTPMRPWTPRIRTLSLKECLGCCDHLSSTATGPIAFWDRDKVNIKKKKHHLGLPAKTSDELPGARIHTAGIWFHILTRMQNKSTHNYFRWPTTFI